MDVSTPARVCFLLLFYVRGGGRMRTEQKKSKLVRTRIPSQNKSKKNSPTKNERSVMTHLSYFLFKRSDAYLFTNVRGYLLLHKNVRSSDEL